MAHRPTRLVTTILWIAGGLLLVVITVLIVRNARGSDDAAALPSSTATKDITTTSGEPAATTSTVSLDSTTTTSGATTSPSTTSPTTTTTTPPTTTTAVRSLVLGPDGIGSVSFGASPDDAIGYAVSILGPADRDTGWVDWFSEFGTCPPPEVRGVQWGTSPDGFRASFTLLFTKAPTTHKMSGGEHLFGYDYYGGTPLLGTEPGMTVGTTLINAKSMYPEMEIAESPWDPAAGVWVVDDEPNDDAQLSGYTTGRGDGDVITSILGGVTCGE